MSPRDPESLAGYVAELRDLAATCAEVLPASRLTVIGYESLIGNPGSGIRRLLDFSGPASGPACLEFRNDPAPVATDSAAQVRQPVLATAGRRQRRHQAYLEPALRILQDRRTLNSAA